MCRSLLNLTVNAALKSVDFCEVTDETKLAPFMAHGTGRLFKHLLITKVIGETTLSKIMYWDIHSKNRHHLFSTVSRQTQCTHLSQNFRCLCNLQLINIRTQQQQSKLQTHGTIHRLDLHLQEKKTYSMSWIDRPCALICCGSLRLKKCNVELINVWTQQQHCSNSSFKLIEVLTDYLSKTRKHVGCEISWTLILPAQQPRTTQHDFAAACT